VTVNETTAQSSNIIQRDRKGKSMTVSPAGYGTTPGSATDEVRTFPLSLADAEQLPLSAWVGISGAAFSTGVGQNTSLGQSLLAAMVNMRLGYWWNAPTTPRMGWPRRYVADLVAAHRCTCRSAALVAVQPGPSSLVQGRTTEGDARSRRTARPTRGGGQRAGMKRKTSAPGGTAAQPGASAASRRKRIAAPHPAGFGVRAIRSRLCRAAPMLSRLAA
jgi:hypothetical protein